MPAESSEPKVAENPWALEDWPPFPWITTKVLQLFSSEDEDLAIKRLIELIRADASLSSELLRRANSALYGLRSQISSLQHAIVILGLDQVKALAMTIGLSSYLRSALRLVVLRRCWRHSISCGLLSEELAPACGIASDQAYTAGLLHDIGRLALLVKHPEPYANLLSVVMENNFSLLGSEKDLFDVDHCEAGEWLASEWSFPVELRQVVASHHYPPANGRFGLVKLVHLSCRLADSLGFQVAAPSEPEEPQEILAELPVQAQCRLHLDLTSLRETLTRKVNALE